MSDALENKAVEILDKSQAAIATFADKLADMAKQYGPDVADAALQMARVDAASKLIPAIICVVATAFFVPKLVPRFIAWGKAADNDNPLPFVIMAFGGTAVAMANIGSAVALLDVWRWVGIFEPKLWLAKRILGL